MKIRITLASIIFSVTFSLWSTTQEALPESGHLIRTRRLSDHPIDRLEEKQLIAKNLRQFFVPFNENATNLMVLNNLCQAMNEGMHFTVEIWDHYMQEHKILTTEQIPLFRSVYGSVLRALRENETPYFNPRDYFKSSCFLELLYGELGAESFPSTYLKPLVFAEWQIYKRNVIVLFVQDFATCVGGVATKIQSFIKSDANSLTQWDSLPAENLCAIKPHFDFQASLATLRLLNLKVHRLGLRRTTKICKNFLNSLNSFQEVCAPLARELQVIIDNKKLPGQKTPRLLEESDLKTWSVEGIKISNLVDPLIKEKRKSIQNPDYILTAIQKSLKEDAEAVAKFQTKGAEQVSCSLVEINTSGISVGEFLNNLWPTLSPFFREGGAISLSTYGTLQDSETEEALRSLRSKIQQLEELHKEKIKETQEIFKSLNSQLMTRIRSLELSLKDTRSSLEKERETRIALAKDYLLLTEEQERKHKEYERIISSHKTKIADPKATSKKKQKGVMGKNALQQKTDIAHAEVETLLPPEPCLEEAHGNTPPTPKRKSPPPIKEDLSLISPKSALRPEAPAFNPLKDLTVLPDFLPQPVLRPAMILIETPYGPAWVPISAFPYA